MRSPMLAPAGTDPYRIMQSITWGALCPLNFLVEKMEFHMSKQATLSALAGTALILGLAGTASAQAPAPNCVPISGKIANNFAAADGSATLGVVALEYGPKRGGIKMKCALSGVSAGVPVPGQISFIHSISCDDAISVPAGDGSGDVPVHSSIVLYTTGTIFPPESPTQEFTFQEFSVPILTAPARGLFYGVTGGQLQVTGAVYKSPVWGVPGSIDMKFSGEVCYGG